MDKLRKVIVISGMTGVGKTNIAKVLAQHINGELISADSLQVYKGLDILTNKPAGNNQVNNAAIPTQRAMLSQEQSLGAAPYQPYHLMNHYDPMKPISAQCYAQDARTIIRDILSRNKTPIIEGGSPFYINQIFNPQLTNFTDDTFKEARQVAKRIIELDGNKFRKSMTRCEELLSKLEVPKSEAKKIGENDFYRLETKMAFALYLQAKGLSYSKFLEQTAQNEDNQFFTKGIDQRNFYFYGNKAKINQVLDLRVEDMILNPAFFQEVTYFAKLITTQTDANQQVKLNPLVRSIGFPETVQFLRTVLQADSDQFIHFDYRRKPQIRQQYTKALNFYLNDFKAKTRQYAKRQNIWYRKEADFVWMDAMGGDSGPKRMHQVVNRLFECLKMDKNSLQIVLDSDEQAKMRAVNTEQEKILKEYKSEGRIMQDSNIQNEFLMAALSSAKNHKNLYMNDLFKGEETQSNIVAPTSTTSHSLFPTGKVVTGSASFLEQQPKKRHERVVSE